MSYYQIIRATRQLCMNSRYFILRSNLNLKSFILNTQNNYLRSFSTLTTIEPKANHLKYEDVRTQINSLLQDSSDLKTENTVLALHYCGKSSPSLTINQRRTLSKEIWESLSDYSNDGICHAYIQACIDNDESVNHVEYLCHIKFKPNTETFKLLLESACNVGDKSLALNILEIMKKENYPADVDVFNLLVLGYSISGGYNEAKSILDMMRLARIKSTDTTNWNILRGVATFKNSSEFTNILESNNFVFNPHCFLDVVHRLGMEDGIQNIKKLINKIERTEIPRHLSKHIIDLCKQFIQREKPNIAFEIYCLLIEPLDETYGIPLLEEMIQFHIPNEIVVNLTKELVRRNLNPTTLQSITEFVLRNKYFEVALELFQAFPKLKPHYFWPLLIEKAKETGQIGLFETVKIMENLQVSIDTDTLYFYIVPNCDLSDPLLLINNLKQLNFTAKDVFSPILAVLLLRNNASNCMDLCKKHDLPVDGQRLLKPLINFYKKFRNFDTTILVLQRICETNVLTTDWAGIFLLQIVKGPKNNNDFHDYLKFLKMVRGVKLSITAAYFESIMTYLQGRIREPALIKDIKNILENLVDSTKEETVHIEHPRNMNIEDLECHMVELVEKQMDTRGVIRRLIQEHSRLENHKRLLELREIYRNSGYIETAGMKGSIMNSFIVSEKLDEALNVYSDIKKEYPNFNIDSFKIIDLANLLVKNEQFNDAKDLLQKECANIRHAATPALERNCWRLLSSCTNPEQLEVLFKQLIDNNLCKISNVILGPLIKIHLNSGNLEAAVEVYRQCVKRHKCTPLQLELLTRIVQREDSQEFLHEVLTLTASIHGNAAARLSLLAALAESGYERPLTKFLMENGTIPSKLVQARCDRWITENKLSPLITLFKSIERLPGDIMDKAIVQNAILKLYSSKQDCDSALQFYEELRNKDIEVDNEFNKNLLALLKRYNYNIPDSLYA